jgi:hypothetical protein
VAQQAEAVLARELYVDDRAIERCRRFLAEPTRFGGVAGFVDAIAALGEDLRENPANVVVVVDDENAK